MPPTLRLNPTREKKPYRLKCHLKIEPYPSRSRLEIEKVRIAERFVRDMHTQGWENLPGHGFKMAGPFPAVTPMDLHYTRIPTASEMLPGVMQGARFLDSGVEGVQLVPKIHESEWWEFEISGVFIRDELHIEQPERHEEKLR